VKNNILELFGALSARLTSGDISPESDEALMGISGRVTGFLAFGVSRCSHNDKEGSEVEAACSSPARREIGVSFAANSGAQAGKTQSKLTISMGGARRQSF